MNQAPSSIIRVADGDRIVVPGQMRERDRPAEPGVAVPRHHGQYRVVRGQRLGPFLPLIADFGKGRRNGD